MLHGMWINLRKGLSNSFVRCFKAYDHYNKRLHHPKTGMQPSFYSKQFSNSQKEPR